MNMRSSFIILCTVLGIVLIPSAVFARDLDYRGSEITVYVKPGEPTQIEFPGEVSGGFRKKMSTLSLDKKDNDLIIFSSESLADEGEAIIVRLDDGRSYSIRIQPESPDTPRDASVRLYDDRPGQYSGSEEEAPYEQKEFKTASPSQVTGLLREMVLVAEFGKEAIAGYRVTDRYQGEAVLDDGTLRATIDRIFIGPDYWGYVLDASNELDESQKINPASFRLDGTRAISMSNWELTPKPLNIEQQISGKHKTKVYVITRARR